MLIIRSARPAIAVFAMLAGCSDAGSKGTIAYEQRVEDDGARAEYRQEFRARLDSLVFVLANFGVTDGEAPMIALQDNRVREVDVSLGASSSVFAAAEHIVDLLNQIPGGVLTEDLDGFEAWGVGMKADHAHAQAQAELEFAKIRATLTANPVAFRSDFGPAARLASDSTVIFVYAGRTIPARALLGFDLAAWLDRAMEMAQTFQPPPADAPADSS